MPKVPKLQTLKPGISTLDVSGGLRTLGSLTSAKKNGRGGRPWRRTVEWIKLRDHYRCYVCGRVTEEGDVDHKVPLSQGGSGEDINLGWICREPCHREKSARECFGKG